MGLSAADHAGKLFRQMFPHDPVAKKYSCGRTKTTAVMKACANDRMDATAADMKSGPFILGTDGSQEGEEKYFPIVIRSLDIAAGCVRTSLLANPTCSESATGENIFQLLEDELKSRNINWGNCLSLVCDNCNVMTGKNKGVIKFVRDKSPAVHLAGCVCHLLDLAAKKATKEFQGEFNFDDILRQLGWYLSKSTNRAKRLKSYQEKCNVPQHKIIQHVPTRWLALGAALRRMLEQWEPLSQFFKEECSKDTKDHDSIKAKIRDVLKRRTAKVKAHFLVHAMEVN